jgi:hypothetical protein
MKKVLLLILVLETCYWGWDWSHRSKISSIGGLYFFKRVELTVPIFHQSDPLWKADPLGKTSGNLGAEGCAVVSAAMVLNFYEIPTDPKHLNCFLTYNEGYTDRGWIYWEKAAELEPHKIEKAYEDKPSYFLIDWNLLRGNPVIVRLGFPSHRTHFVVIVGKEGFHYLIADPGSGYNRGVYRLSELTLDIEALRYYHRL